MTVLAIVLGTTLVRAIALRISLFFWHCFKQKLRMLTVDAGVALRCLGFKGARGLASEGLRGDRLAALFPAALRRRLVRVDVRADGHCGAHVLALFVFALHRRAVSQMEVRRCVYNLACAAARSGLPPALNREFARTFRTIARQAFLNDTEMALFLHAHRLNVHILTPTHQLLIQSFRIRRGVGHAFLIFAQGCHWQILAQRTPPSKPGGFSPVWTPSEGDALLSRLCAEGAILRKGVPPRTTYTAIVQGVPLFRVDAEDRLWV